jgi:hypothetical protein
MTESHDDPDTLAELIEQVESAIEAGWPVTSSDTDRLLAVARDHAEACEKRDHYQMAYEEESELHAELRSDHARMAAENERLRKAQTRNLVGDYRHVTEAQPKK